jgi:hypothetical protein
MTKLTKVVVAAAVLAVVGLVGSAIAGAKIAGEQNGKQAKLEQAPVVAARKKTPSKAVVAAVDPAPRRARAVNSAQADHVIVTAGSPSVEPMFDDSDVAQQDDQSVADLQANDDDQDEQQNAALDDELTEETDDDVEDDDVDEDEVDVEVEEIEVDEEEDDED